MELIELYALMPEGQENAISIKQLAELWGMSERMARKTCEEMIYQDLYVCNLRSGYFRPARQEELAAYDNIIHSYSKKLQRKRYKTRRGVLEWDVWFSRTRQQVGCTGFINDERA